MKIFKNHPDKGRLIGSTIYFILATLLLIGGLYWFGVKGFFYNNAFPGFENARRIIWIISWVFFGFSSIAFQASKATGLTPEAFPTYYTKYLAILAIDSVIVFSACHLFKSSSGYLFYFIAAAAGFILGYFADENIDWLRNIILRFGK